MDHNRLGADVMSVRIRLLGYEVERAYSVQHALAIASRFNPDTIFIDLPEEEAFDLARKLIARQSKARLVALSSWLTPQSAAKADAVGFDLILRKPITADQLVDALSTPKAANEG
ncbi:MAG TPA: response regulator [Nevskiaceae bacterium]|nr:response regulator [Nevskiaceae bacterium]